MAVKRRTKPGRATRMTLARTPVPKVSLPEERSVPAADLTDYSMLLFGEKKIGKTSLASHFPDAFCLMFEPGGKALRIFQRAVPDWPTFLAYLDLLEGTEQFRTVVVDTVDIAYACCFEFVCKRLGIEHPNDERDYGKSWKAIEDEYVAAMTRLLHLERGVVFISHDQLREITARDGSTYDRLLPSLPKQASRFLEGVVDIWAYYGYWGNRRYLVLRGNETIGAGCRLEEQFRTTGGDAVIAVPMGTSSKAAYRALVAAFNNQQESTGGEIFKPKAKAVRKES